MVHALHRAERETCGRVRNSCCETVDSNLHLRHFSRTTFISINRRTTPLCHRWPKHFGLTPVPRFIRRLKRLSNHFFTLLPKGFGVGWIHRVGSNSFADRGDGDVVWNDVGNVAVLAVTSADFIRWDNYAGPRRGRSTLRNRLPLEGPFAFRSTLRTDPIDQSLNFVGADVPSQLGLYASGMHGGGTHATPAMPLVETDGKEDVCGLRPTIGDPWVVRRPLKVGIL